MVEKGNVKTTFLINSSDCGDSDEDEEILTTAAPSIKHQISIIKNQMEDSAHPINIVIDEFTALFSDGYREYVDKRSKPKEQLYHKLQTINQMLEEKEEGMSPLRRNRESERQVPSSQ